MVGPHPIDPAIRFTQFFTRSADDCWEWQGARFASGYGQFYAGKDANGKRINSHAHRFAWQLAFGAIPAGQHVLHRCDNPPCVNPGHLFLGTRSDNMRDMTTKGRGRPFGRSTLSVGEVVAIRAKAADRLRGDTKEIARQYGVSTSLIRAIWRGEIWKFHNQEMANG